MAKQTVITLSGNTAGTQVGTAFLRHEAPFYSGVVFVGGTFGSGTVTLNLSPDGGTTLYPMKDTNGNAISATSASMFNFQVMGNGNKNQADQNIGIYAVLTGSTSPAINVSLFDNR